MAETRLLIDQLKTPVGEFAIVADESGCLHAAGWTDGHARMERDLAKRGYKLTATTNPSGLTVAIRAYFDGDVLAIDKLAVDAAGTEFQHSVWNALREIPCGVTCSYGELAKKIGRPSAVRAVGLANGSNPIGVIVPCHRVIGSDGSLTGYGGGMERKRWLLAHEAKFMPRADGPLFSRRQHVLGDELRQ